MSESNSKEANDPSGLDNHFEEAGEQNAIGIAGRNNNPILTSLEKSKIKIIKNPECKSWTYEKGKLQ